MDNTYCDPIFRFPSREVVTDCILKIIDIKKSEFKKVIVTTYTLGKEELMLKLANYFKVKLVLNEQRYK